MAICRRSFLLITAVFGCLLEDITFVFVFCVGGDPVSYDEGSDLAYNKAAQLSSICAVPYFSFVRPLCIEVVSVALRLILR